MIPAVNAMGGRARWLPEQAAAEGGTTSQRVRPPASIALDRGYGIPAAIGRQNEGPTGPLMWVTGSAVARRMPWVDPSSA